MKNLRLLFIFSLVITLLVVSCTLDRDTEGPANVSEPIIEQSDNGPLQKITINPNRAAYDVVVLDIDRWEICLNVNRVRNNITSYTGHLWYQSGSFVFEGSCTAMYDPIYEELTVMALDSGWSRGHIVYNLKFNDESSLNMEGGFVYYEYPRRVSRITAWLEQGVLGEHDAGPWTGKALAKKGDIEYAPRVHPKKARLELEN
ncbi:MAG: hypothetical protein KKA84_05020 [Bacteroidetes bacterium]|nr:hypothetical protein [Bacteroidota bacterium]